MYIKKIVISLLFALFACPGFAQEEVVWWDFLSGGDGVRMKALIERFNNEHQDIKINATTFEWGIPYYTKVRTAVSVGEAPDIMTYHISRFPLGLKEGVLDSVSDEDLAQAGLDKEQFFATSVAAATADDGKLYGVPFDIHSMVLFYNKSWLEGSRFLGGDGKLTGINSLQDFEEALVWAREKGAEVPLAYGTAGGGSSYRVFYTLLRQAGAELINAAGEILPNDGVDKLTEVIGIMRHWAEEGWQPEQTESEAAIAMFTAGRAAFLLYGVWEVTTMTDLEKSGALGFNWGAEEVPNLLGTRTTWADSHAFAIPAGKNMSAEKRRAVMEVIGWMAKNSLAWAGAGHIPALKAVTQSEEFRQMEPNASYVSLADRASYDPRSPIAGVASPVYDIVDRFVAPAVHGYLSPKEAAEQIKQDLQDQLQ